LSPFPENRWHLTGRAAPLEPIDQRGAFGHMVPQVARRPSFAYGAAAQATGVSDARIKTAMCTSLIPQRLLQARQQLERAPATPSGKTGASISSA